MAEAQLTNKLTHIDTMTCVELRAELKQRGSSTSGNKKELIAKLNKAVQKEYEHSISTAVQHSSLDNFIIPQNMNPSINLPQIINIPEIKTTRARSKKSSVDSRSDEISNSTASINNEEIILDTSTNDNNIEVTSFVSKSNEEKVGDIGGESHSLYVDSSSAKSESIIKEIPLSDEQQRLNPSEAIHEEQTSATNISNDDIKDLNQVINQSSNADLKSPVIKQQESIEESESTSVDPEPEKAASQQQLKPSLSQTVSLLKNPNRLTNNKINLTLEVLKTLISDISLASESVINDELDALIDEPILETSAGNNLFISNSMTIGELADQKQPTNRTVVMDINVDSSSLNDDLNVRKKQNQTATHVPSFESKTLLNGKSNTTVTDEPVRIKDVTVAQEPLSHILYIRGLTRPFSLFQIKGLLSRYGTLVDGEFWLDKIKSQCFVTYNILEEAQNAREALDGCRWPSTNPKTLSVRFARQDEFDFSKTHDLPPDEMSIDSIDRIIQEKTNVISSRRSISPVNKKNHLDVPKLQDQIQSAFLITEEIEEVKTNEPSVKGLDDYFRKTKAKPSIYWLPLTEEQIIERNHRQEQRKAERDEEQRKREVDENTRKPDSKPSRRSPSLQEKRKRSSSPSKRNSKRH